MDISSLLAQLRASPRKHRDELNLSNAGE